MIEASEYAYRRLKVLDELEEGSIAILYAGVGKIRSGDQNYDFAVNRNFYYLTGIEQENSVLLFIKASGERHEYLFIDEKNEKVEKWLGIKMTTEEARNISGIDNVLVRSALEGKISAALGGEMTQFGRISTVYFDLEKELKIGAELSTTTFADKFQKDYPNIVVKDIHDIVMSHRMIKSKAEVEMIKDAINTTDVALKNVLKSLAAGRFEYNMRNVFEFNVFEDLNAKLAFPSIVAGGKNAVILHYPDAQDVLRDGDLILLDVGAAKGNYCADISRTYPISGSYSPLQKQIYNIVLECNKATIKFMRPGLTLKEVKEFAKNYLAEECFAQALISSKDKINDVYYHSVSHHLGLDTHDGNDREGPLVPGNVITCEPGLYFKEYGIGVRIEDDVLITESGSECLSENVIKDIEDIERILISK